MQCNKEQYTRKSVFEEINEQVVVKAEDRPADPAAQKRKGRVLLISDGVMRQSIARAMLETCGYSVYRSRNDSSAIEDYLLAKKAGYPFDFVVMDLWISYSIGGKETIRKLIAADPDAKALIMASNRIDPIMERFEEHGFQGALAKPFTIRQLQKAIIGSLAGADRRHGESQAGKFLQPQ